MSSRAAAMIRARVSIALAAWCRWTDVRRSFVIARILTGRIAFCLGELRSAHRRMIGSHDPARGGTEMSPFAIRLGAAAGWLALIGVVLGLVILPAAIAGQPPI